MTELARLSDDLAAQTEAFLRRGGAITQLNWAGVPVDGTAIEPKPVRAYGRLHVPPVPKPSAPTVEAPQPKALPVVEVAPAPTASHKVSVPVVDHPATERHLQRMSDSGDWSGGMASGQTGRTIRRLRELRADARRWLRRLDASFPR